MKNFTILIVVLLTCIVAFGQDIPREGLVGYWKLDEGDGFVTADSSGYGADGELFGNAFWIEGYMGNALEFDGIDGYVDMGIGDGQFDLEFEVTLSVWVNQWSLGNGEDDPWLGKGDNAYAIKHQRGNFYEFFVFDGGWHSCEVPLDSAHLYTWHHFAGTFDGFEMKMYFYGEPADKVHLLTTISISEHPGALAWN